MPGGSGLAGEMPSGRVRETVMLDARERGTATRATRAMGRETLGAVAMVMGMPCVKVRARARLGTMATAPAVLGGRGRARAMPFARE